MTIKPKAIWAARMKLGLTQLEFAERLGVDPVTVSRWERGVSTPQGRGVRARLAALIAEAEKD